MAAESIQFKSGDDKPKVAVLGVGLMGNKICRRLQQEGFAVLAWNRDHEKTEKLKDVCPTGNCRTLRCMIEQSSLTEAATMVSSSCDQLNEGTGLTNPH
jgi:3-hydroxyisobutyrate dehydrogenase-like beta-hydroxyacid dehydrogenase